MRFSILATLAFALFSAPPAAAQQYTPSGPIEQKYAADGPWAVTTTATTQGCDREGNVCDIWYPTDLGTNPIKGMASGFRHPIIVFADGTASDLLTGVSTVTADSWAPYLKHLASWGFVVIRSRDGNTARGDTVLDVRAYISARANDAQSIFYNKIDPDNIGLTGHSQGAATAVILFSQNDGLFKTVVPLDTPLRIAMEVGNLAPDLGTLSQVTRGSIFYIGGGLDAYSPLTTNLGYYAATSNAVDKEMGIVTLAMHGDPGGTPGCAPLTPLCNLGVYPFLGYPTAWFMWKLQGAADGPDAFRTYGELYRASPNWIGVVSNIH